MKKSASQKRFELIYLNSSCQLFRELRSGNFYLFCLEGLGLGFRVQGLRVQSGSVGFRALRMCTCDNLPLRTTTTRCPPPPPPKKTRHFRVLGFGDSGSGLTRVEGLGGSPG